MSGIQLIAVAFAGLMIFITYNSFRRSQLRVYEFGLWMAIWAGLALISLFPDRLRAVIAPLQIARLLDLVIITGLLLLSAIVFSLNRTVRRLEDRLAALVRNLALDASAAEEGQRSNSE